MIRPQSTYSMNDPFPYNTATTANASSSIAAMYDESCYNPGGPDYVQPYQRSRGTGGHGSQFPELSFPPTGYESGYVEYEQYSGGNRAGNYYHHQPQPVDRIFDQHSADLISNFMRAACSNCIKMITDMIRDDVVSPNAQDQSHMTAIMYASLNGHMNVVRKLIEFGANVSYTHPYTENTALHLAAQCGHTRTVELLLKSGQLRPNMTNRDGKTAYQLARDFGHGQNKVMKRLFQEFGGYVEYSGGARGGMRKSAPDDDSSEESDSSSVVDSQECDVPKNPAESSSLSTKLTIAPPPQEGVSELKQSSMLPNYELLVRFSQIGVYRPLGSGKGFAFLAPHGTTAEMVKYACIALQVDTLDGGKELKTKLKNILHDFEEDLLLKAQVTFEAQHPEKMAGSADHLKDHPLKRNAHNRRGGGSAHGSNNRDQQSESSTMSLDPETEKQNYLRWKKVNMNKIQEMIDAIP